MEVVEEEVGGHYFAGSEWVGVVVVSLGCEFAGGWEFGVEDADAGVLVYDELRRISDLDVRVGSLREHLTFRKMIEEGFMNEHVYSILLSRRCRPFGIIFIKATDRTSNNALLVYDSSLLFFQKAGRPNLNIPRSARILR